MILREIKPSDNLIIEQIVKSSILEFDLPMIGSVYEDDELKDMYNAYQGKRETYFVVEENGKVIGGGGIKELNNSGRNICELQKMYLTPDTRGKGYGHILLEKCLKAASGFKYDSCYLETAPALETAIYMYKKYGFEFLKGPIGATKHYACGIWMFKNLTK